MYDKKIASIGTEAIQYIQAAEKELHAKTGTEIILVAYERKYGK